MQGYTTNYVNLIADNLRDRYQNGFPILSGGLALQLNGGGQRRHHLRLPSRAVLFVCVVGRNG